MNVYELGEAWTRAAFLVLVVAFDHVAWWLVGRVPSFVMFGWRGIYPGEAHLLTVLVMSWFLPLVVLVCWGGVLLLGFVAVAAEEACHRGATPRPRGLVNGSPAGPGRRPGQAKRGVLARCNRGAR